MFKTLFSEDPYVAGFAIFGLVVFFTMFVAVVIWAIFGKKSYMKKMSKLPLD